MNRAGENVLFLRYEDMSLDQMKTAKQVYSFIGEKITKKLESWIQQAMKQEGSNSGTYSTNKNSIKTMTAWRNKINFDEVIHYVAA